MRSLHLIPQLLLTLLSLLFLHSWSLPAPQLCDSIPSCKRQLLRLVSDQFQAVNRYAACLTGFARKADATFVPVFGHQAISSNLRAQLRSIIMLGHIVTDTSRPFLGGHGFSRNVASLLTEMGRNESQWSIEKLRETIAPFALLVTMLTNYHRDTRKAARLLHKGHKLPKCPTPRILKLWLNFNGERTHTEPSYWEYRSVETRAKHLFDQFCPSHEHLDQQCLFRELIRLQRADPKMMWGANKNQIIAHMENSCTRLVIDPHCLSRGSQLIKDVLAKQIRSFTDCLEASAEKRNGTQPVTVARRLMAGLLKKLVRRLTRQTLPHLLAILDLEDEKFLSHPYYLKRVFVRVYSKGAFDYLAVIRREGKFLAQSGCTAPSWLDKLFE